MTPGAPLERRAFLLALVAAGASRNLGAVARLTDLGSIDELKARFNRDAGNVRLVLLLSPT